MKKQEEGHQLSICVSFVHTTEKQIDQKDLAKPQRLTASHWTLCGPICVKQLLCRA